MHSADRQRHVDVFRGLLIAHMGLDHASLMYNAGRGAEELASAPPPVAADAFQFFTRFSGIPVAPGFFFMAGMMVALTSSAREARGVAPKEVTRRLIVRGLVLIFADALVLGPPRASMGYYSFMVLSSIGVAIILLALARRAPSRILLPAALAVLVLHPLVDVSALPVGLRAILYEPVRTGAFRSLYPVIPWSAIVFVGFVVGRDAVTRERPVRLWVALGGICLMAFFGIRLVGGYGNAFPHDGPTSPSFWAFAKYPPDLPFLAWAFAATFIGLALVAWLTRAGTPWALRPFALFGRVPFFFYLTHFYVLGLGFALVGHKVGLLETYCVWAMLLAVMAWPCAWYFEKKRDRPNFVTRYL